MIETIDTAWGKGTGEVCRCDYIGPPPDCCRLIKISAKGGGFTVTGDCEFPTCEDIGNCILIGVSAPDVEVNFYAACMPDGFDTFPDNTWFNPNGSDEEK